MFSSTTTYRSDSHLVNGCVNSYRYGFNGQEKIDEIHGTGNYLDFTFRGYNPRIGRFLAMDPLSKTYPHLTPYQFASNTPIQAIDIDGLEGIIFHVKQFQVGETFFQTTDVEYLNNNDGRILYMVHDLDAQTLTEIWQDPVNIRYEPSFTEKLLTGIQAVHNAQMAVNNYIMDTPNRMDGLKARMTGGWENYGEGEDWVKASGFELGVEASLGPWSASAKAKTYSTSENNIGFSFSASFKSKGQATSSGSTITNWKPSASISGGLYVNTKSSNIETGTKFSNLTYTSASMSIGLFKTGGDDTGNFSIGLGTPSISGKGGFVSEQKFSFTTGTSDF